MLSILLLAALIKVNLECKSPWVATSLYTGSLSLLALMFGHHFLAVLIAAMINTGLGFLYFWLLKKTEDSSNWWLVLILGLIAFIALGFF